jgi:Tfp pilus assembly protein PilV
MNAKAKNENHRKITPRKGTSGVTLVELMVAAVIILVSVIATVGVIRMSTSMQVTDYHRRQARALAMSEFETTFGFNRFSTGEYVSAAHGYNIDLTDIEINVEVSTEPIAIMRVVGDNTFDGNIVVAVTPRNRDIGLGIGNEILAHEIAITVTWVEPNGHTDFITLTKELTSIDI